MLRRSAGPGSSSVPPFGVYEPAASIPGIRGVEVTTTRGNLWERENVHLALAVRDLRWRSCSPRFDGASRRRGTNR